LKNTVGKTVVPTHRGNKLTEPEVRAFDAPWPEVVRIGELADGA